MEIRELMSQRLAGIQAGNSTALKQQRICIGTVCCFQAPRISAATFIKINARHLETCYPVFLIDLATGRDKKVKYDPGSLV